MDPEYLDPYEGEIEEDTGSTQRPPEAPEDGLSSPNVSNSTDPSQHTQETPWEESQVRLTTQGTQI